VVVLGLVWIPVMRGISDILYQYLQSVQSYLAPPIAAVFLLGVFSKRINATGAFTTMIVGFIIGLLRIGLELMRGSLTGILHAFATVNFLYFCIFLFVFSITLLVVVSLLTEKPSEAQLAGLTYATTVKEDRAASRRSWNKWDVILSAFVVVFIIAVFIYFSPFGIVK
jgi:SSS family solute:Na+ symporter